MTTPQVLVLSIFSLLCLPVLSQRGCPEEGCDSRGLNCQADFHVNGTDPKVIWATPIGTYNTDVFHTSGCVGNDENVICISGDQSTRTLMSLETATGVMRWKDSLLTSTRFPVMNLEGDIIAADSKFLEMRLSNGSLAGEPANFYGHISNISSIHYVKEPILFFFVSHDSGGIYYYDTSGMCVASMFLIVKDPKTNDTVSVWKPTSKLVVNTEMPIPCTYFIARNNVSLDYRMYALSFNHEPPYIREKWHIDVNISSQEEHPVKDIRLLVRGSAIFCGLDLEKTLVIEDQGDSGVIRHSIPLTTKSFASFDIPVLTDMLLTEYSRKHRLAESHAIVWSHTEDKSGGSVIVGWDISANSKNFSIDLAQFYGFDSVVVTSEIMVFGYQPKNTTLVFGFTATTSGAVHSASGCYVAALNPMPDGSIHREALIQVGSSVDKVVGQIIGVRDSTMVATLDTPNGYYALGLKVGT